MAPKRRAKARSDVAVEPTTGAAAGSSITPRRSSDRSRGLFGAAIAIATVAAWAAWTGAFGPADPAVTPIDLPRMTALPQFAGCYARQMLWGSYRPGLYLGLRMRRPVSLLAGLMWFDPGNGAAAAQQLRHEAQERDGLRKYGWARHDGRTFGVQELLDGHLNITTSLVKRHCNGCGGGGDWAVRLTAARASDVPAQQAADDGTQPPVDRLSLLFYLADEQVKRPVLRLVPRTTGYRQGGGGLPGRHLAEGYAPGAGAWELHASGSNVDGKPAEQRLLALSLHTPHFHNLTDLVRAHLGTRGLGGQGELRLRRPQGVARGEGSTGASGLLKPKRPNMVIWQLTGDLPLTLDLVFLGGPTDAGEIPPSGWQQRWVATLRKTLASLLPRSHSQGSKGPTAGDSGSSSSSGSGGSVNNGSAAVAGLGGGGDGLGAPAERVAALTGDSFSAMLQQRISQFDADFRAKFGNLDSTEDSPRGAQEAGKRALSNMLGGLGYFYGRPRIGVHDSTKPGAWIVKPGVPTALFTGVPSRSFFPRGFLWDEGFHQVLVRHWDAALSRDVLAHWLDSMAATGWIPREQILGAEAEARVPQEFITQKVTSANPPTLFLALEAMARSAEAASARGENLSSEQLAEQDFLRAALPRLEAWFAWFHHTQAGQLPGAFRWRGREVNDHELNPKTLTSGLDDAPRASHPSAEERHVDLRCWMALAARSLATITAAVGAPRPEVKAAAKAAKRLGNFTRLVELHWSEARQQFLDFGNHSQDVTLQWALEHNEYGQPIRRVLRRVVATPPEPRYVPQFGYLSLFPLLMRLLPADSHELGVQLAQLTEPDLLWTPFGLRSLAKTASLYRSYNTEHDAPYWRAPIWFNANFLALQALQHYGKVSGPHQGAAEEAHTQLRRNLLRTVVREYQRTGFLWENYDDEDGHGRGTHPFTGWSALFVLS
mmetsp:Transcript_7619/g.22485  ORF Transcript_7619/g.22485 Transcript_7619/m.22485 type:complete len:941 (+) Transcript_7619:605-3427(+)